MEDKKLSGYPSVDKPWLKYYSQKAIKTPLPEVSMYTYMTDSNQDRLNETALVYFGRKITHRQFQQNIDRCACALTAMGVNAGDRVSLCLLAMPETIYLLYAINKLGAVANFLILNATPDTIQEQIQLAESHLVIALDMVEPQIAKAVDGLPGVSVVSLSLAQSMPPIMAALYREKAKRPLTAFTPWEQFLAGGKNITPPVDRGKAVDPAVIVYTGGTTGKSKGVLLSNGAANAVAFQYTIADGVLNFFAGQRFLDILPPFLSYGIFFGIHVAMCGKQINYLIPDPAPDKFPGVFIKYKPHHFSGGPLHIEAMMQNKKIQNMELSFVHTAAYGGDSMSEEREEAASSFLRERNCRSGLLKGYGMTEMSSSICTATHKTSFMIPLVHNNIKIVDVDTGMELGYGQEGEIYVTGPGMMLGYYRQEEATRETITEENGIRWLRTGDLGYVTEDGAFYITGRIKRLLWALSQDVVYRVYPMAIERVIDKHPAVRQCAVVGKPDGDRGFLVIAYIILKDGTPQSVQSQLNELCQRELPIPSQPYAYRFVEKLPITSAGKVNFRELEKWERGEA